MTFYCPVCRKEIPEDDVACPYCGADGTSLGQKSFNEKLIRDLQHPARDRVGMAVRRLGELKTAHAVAPLVRLFETTDDPFLQREILGALDRIGTEDALNFIMESIEHPISMVRRRAWEIMEERATRKK